MGGDHTEHELVRRHVFDFYCGEAAYWEKTGVLWGFIG
jgi:hypothetical protein